MKTAISVPDALFDAAEAFASRLGISRSQLFTRALQTYLAHQRDDGVTAKLDEVYADEDSGVDRELARMQLTSLPPEAW